MCVGVGMVVSGKESVRDGRVLLIFFFLRRDNTLNRRRSYRTHNPFPSPRPDGRTHTQRQQRGSGQQAGERGATPEGGRLRPRAAHRQAPNTQTQTLSSRGKKKKHSPLPCFCLFTRPTHRNPLSFFPPRPSVFLALPQSSDTRANSEMAPMDVILATSSSDGRSSRPTAMIASSPLPVRQTVM